METHGQARLVLVRHGPGRGDDPRPSWHQDTLPVRRVKGNGDHRQDRSGKVAGELRDQDRFQKRALMDALPTGGIFRRSETHRGGIGGGCRNGGRGGCCGCPSERFDKRPVCLGLCRHFIFEAGCDGRNRAEGLLKCRLAFRFQGFSHAWLSAHRTPAASLCCTVQVAGRSAPPANCVANGSGARRLPA